jgi:hypothetical protein
MRSLLILPIFATIAALSFGTAAQARTFTGPNGSTATGKAGAVNNPQGVVPEPSRVQTVAAVVGLP